MKKKEAPAEKPNLTCPNPSCGRIFPNPIKAKDKQSRNEAYDACPYCLTEISTETNLVEAEVEKTPEPASMAEEDVETRPQKPGHFEPSSKVQGCKHQFGYLGNRPKKDSIPEECMTCEKIVQCMLKNVTG
jgi:hypothetical protein